MKHFDLNKKQQKVMLIIVFALGCLTLLLGKGIRRTEKVEERYFPLVLGMAGIGLCAVWVVGTSCLCSVQEAAMALFTALVQGVLVTGLAVWALRRLEKGKEEK